MFCHALLSGFPAKRIAFVSDADVQELVAALKKSVRKILETRAAKGNR